MLLTTLFRAATPENPRFDLNSPEAWDLLTGGRAAASGLHVTRESALTYSPWWRGVTLLSGGVAKLPLFVYKRVGKGKERDADHPAYYLLRWKPNERQHSFDFVRLVTGHAVTDGNGYAFIMRRGDASPSELIPLDPETTYPVLEDKTLWYVTDVDGEPRKLKAQDVIHVKGFGDDGLCGYSVWDKARDAIGLGKGAQRYQSMQLRRGGRPSVVLETPTKLPDAEINKLRTSWERMQEGIDNAGRTAILHSGLKANPLNITNKDADLVESQRFNVRDISNFLGVPPHKLGDSQRQGYNSLESENQALLDDTLDPWLVSWELECRDKLLTEEQKKGDTHIVEFLRQALQRADRAAQGTYYKTATGGRSWMTPDEVRERENLNPLGGDAADLKDPLNMGQGGDDNEPAPKPPTKEAEAAARDMRPALHAVFEDAASRTLARMRHAAERVAKSPRDFLAWLDGDWAEYESWAEAAFVTPATVAVACGVPVSVRETAEALLGQVRAGLRAVADTATAAKLPSATTTWFAEGESALVASLIAKILPEG